MRFRTLTLLSLLAIPLTVWCQPQVVVTGLQAPNKIILTSGGNLLVTETSPNLNAGRISMVTRAGTRTSLIEGLPSGTEITGGGSGPTAILLRDRTLWVALGAGDTERRVPDSATARMFNLTGYASPLFNSILEFRFNREIDTVTAPLRLTAAQLRALNEGVEVDIPGEGGASARASVFTRFPMAEPIGVPVVYKFSNLWGLALSDDGREMFVGDASGDLVSVVDMATSKWRRMARFAGIPNITPVGPPILDPVPTTVRVYGNQLLVSFLTGFPFVPGTARVLAVNRDGTTEPFIYGLTSATDILVRTRPDGQREFYVLEFSADQSAQAPPPGRLLRFSTPNPEVAAAGLITPVSLAYDAATQDLFILELRGQILRLRLN